MQDQNRSSRPPSFRPPLTGCVQRDRRMANALIPLYIDAFSSLAADIYRSLVCRGHESTAEELFEEMAEADLQEFRLLGELILSLGGDAELHGMRRTAKSGARGNGGGIDAYVHASLSEHRAGIDRYQTLMAHTGDRVVRSILSKLLADRERCVERLEEFQER